MRRSILALFAVLLVTAVGCKASEPPAPPPVTKYERVYIPVTKPDTSLGALRTLRAEIASRGPVVGITVDSAGRQYARFLRTPAADPERTAFAMVQMAWMQSALDRFGEIVDRRTDRFSDGRIRFDNAGVFGHVPGTFDYPVIFGPPEDSGHAHLFAPLEPLPPFVGAPR